MNSTTSDFMDYKRSSFNNELYNRGAFSSVKQKQKKLTLRPLNISGIKKEIEEDLVITRSIDEIKGTAVITKNENELPVVTESVLTDKTNNFGTELTKSIDKNGEDVSCFNSNGNYVVQTKENKQKNDSFDLDFSALSLSTPVKQIDITEMNHVPVRKQFQEFITPKVSNAFKNEYSLSKKVFVKTPMNYLDSVSKRKLHTPVNEIHKHIFAHTISPVLEHDFVPKSEESGNISVPYSEGKVSTPIYKEFPKRKDIIPFKIEETHSHYVPTTLTDLKKIKVNNTEYLVFDLIGRGGSSEVYQCYNLESKLHVAIKCVSLQNSSLATGYVNEVKLLQSLQSCDKIIKMYDYEILESQKQMFVVLENGGKDLSLILKNLARQQTHIPLYMLLFYWMEMLYAVKQIHSHGIIHSDLKPANFLKVDEGLKLIDFGIASSVQTDMTSVFKTKQEGSCNYISPEALRSDSSTNFGSQSLNDAKYKIHYKSDVWSLGCILYQFIYRRTPFQNITQLWPKLAAIMNPEHRIDYPDADWVSPKIIATIKKCLQYNVKARPSVDELIVEYESMLHSI